MLSALWAVGADLVRPGFVPPGSFQGRVPREGRQVCRPFDEALTLPVRVSVLNVGPQQLETGRGTGCRGEEAIQCWQSLRSKV